MRTMNCTITKITEALRANGLQIIARTLVGSRESALSMRGISAVVGSLVVDGFVAGREFARLLRDLQLASLGLPALALQPACPAMHSNMHLKWQTAGRLDRWSVSTTWPAGSRSFAKVSAVCPGAVSIG